MRCTSRKLHQLVLFLSFRSNLYFLKLVVTYYWVWWRYSRGVFFVAPLLRNQGGSTCSMVTLLHSDFDVMDWKNRKRSHSLGLFIWPFFVFVSSTSGLCYALTHQCSGKKFFFSLYFFFCSTLKLKLFHASRLVM